MMTSLALLGSCDFGPSVLCALSSSICSCCSSGTRDINRSFRYGCKWAASISSGMYLTRRFWRRSLFSCSSAFSFRERIS
ncbi:hypothetical protein FKM82_022888 [Ascaphus truei]